MSTSTPIFVRKRIAIPGAGMQRGMTLIELAVAMTIAVFLLGGVFASLQSTRHAYADQGALAQLQDNQRLAMVLLASTIEQAGYFPDPRSYTASGLLLAVAPFTTAGQPIAGTANAAAPGDTITVRYAVAAKVGVLVDNIYSCIGSQYTGTAAPGVFVNTFKVDAAKQQLICTFNGIDYPLVGNKSINGSPALGVTNMSIVYGVSSTAGANGSCADKYETSAQMVAAGDWNIICSVNITLTFVNPTNAAKPFVISRTVAVMNTAGVDS